MAKATRTRRTRTAKADDAEKKTAAAEAQAAADAAQDIEQETAPMETAEAEPQAQTDAAQAEPTEEERFEADVAKAVKEMKADPVNGPQRAMEHVMRLNSDAVTAKAKLDNTLDAWRKKNADSIETLKKGRIRLAAARTTLLKEWRELVNADEQTTTVKNDGEKPDTIYYNALDFAFDDGVAENDKGPEKEMWLAAQSYLRVSDAAEKEPKGTDDLREAAKQTAQAYNWGFAVYNAAIARRLG